VPGRGLEPLRISPPDPKSGASANFATLAIRFRIVNFRLAIANDTGRPRNGQQATDAAVLLRNFRITPPSKQILESAAFTKVIPAQR
jgi:hypothetical protein